MPHMNLPILLLAVVAVAVNAFPQDGIVPEAETAFVERPTKLDAMRATIPIPTSDAEDACDTELSDAGIPQAGVSFAADDYCYSIFPNEAIYQKAGTSCDTPSKDGTLLGKFDEEATSALAHFEGVSAVNGRGRPVMEDGGQTANAKFTGGATANGCDDGRSATLLVLDKDVSKPTGTISEDTGCKFMIRLYIKNCKNEDQGREQLSPRLRAQSRRL
jgi:hypothetical protein